MALFNISPSTANGITTLVIGFGDPASNADIVPFVHDAIDALRADGAIVGGALLLIDGPASLPIAFVLAHGVGHLFANIAVRDPKLGGFVVVTNHGGKHRLGDVIPG